MESPMKKLSFVEVPAALVKAIKEESAVGGGATVEEQASAIIRAAKRALEEAKASEGTMNPSPVVTSLQRFLAQRWAAADVQRDRGSTSS
jgi:hypothetical protein